MGDAQVTQRGWADKVSAVCIGGPFDGMGRDEPGPVFRYVEYPEETSLTAQVSANPVAVKRSQYTAHMVCGVPIWVDASLSLEEAIRQLVRTYNVPPHLRATPPSGDGKQ